MSSKDELALQIGHSILDRYNDMMERKAPGQKYIIPVQLPYNSDEPAWTTDFTMDVPHFVYREYDEDGKATLKVMTLNEYFEYLDNDNKKID